MQLTPHFTLEELIRSETAERERIDNTPSAVIVANLALLAAGLERVRELLAQPLEISSGYRCPELNRRVGGAESSQHTHGMAADFICEAFGGPLEIAQAVRASGIEFDQCILEFGRWVHISFKPQPRGQVLTIYDSKEGYLDGLWDAQGNQVA